MLQHISIKNFLTIEQADIGFTQGLTVLTGETGAGKSVFTDAIRLSLGAKISGDVVRPNTDAAELVAEFNLKNLPEVISWLTEQDLADPEENTFCQVKRIIPQTGRSRVYINGIASALPQLQILGQQLLHVHGQHAHQDLLNQSFQRRLFDRSAKLDKLLSDLAEVFANWHHTAKQLSELKQALQEKQEKLDLLRYQVEELDELALKTDEWEALDQLQKKLSNQEAIRAAIEKTLYELDGDLSSHHSLRTSLEKLQQALMPYTQYQPALSDVVNNIQQATIHIEEAISSLKDQLYDDEADIDLVEVETRIQKIMDLSRKHHVSPASLVQKHAALAAELAEIDDFTPKQKQLETTCAMLRAQYIELAQAVSSKRQQYAKEFKAEVEPHLTSLGMPHAQFKIELPALVESEWNAHGQERVCFMVKTNPEQDFHFLSDVVSGGELSRISLAIEAISVEQLDKPTFIFDEVDVGVGGTTAKTIGQLLQKIAVHKQILCITHLPQVAVFGTSHIKIEKEVHNNKTYSRLGVLDEAERLHEIVRMLGTAQQTEESLSYAKNLLSLSF